LALQGKLAKPKLCLSLAPSHDRKSYHVFISRWFQGFDWESLSNLSLKPPKITTVNGPLDLTNFDTFSSESETPPDETSGWDAEF
jgi:hypothetical protein